MLYTEHDQKHIFLSLPMELWEELVGRAAHEQENETQLLIRAIEQFLHQDGTQLIQSEPLQQIDENSVNSKNGNTASSIVHRNKTKNAEAGDEWATLRQIVAEIKQLPPNLETLQPATKSIEQLILELVEDPSPESDITPNEWDQEWAAYEIAQKVIDLADEQGEEYIYNRAHI